LIKETHKLLRGTLPSTIRMELDIRTKRDTVAADPSQIQQVLMNLATNAAHAMRETGGELTIALAHTAFEQGSPMPDGEMSPGTYVKLTVRDTGKGMTDETRRRIFEPFFTTKPTGQGTGMGLAVVYGIVKSHEGVITVQSEPGKGSEFTIFLPHAREPAEEETKEAGATPGGRERILLVDDEPLILDMTVRVLEDLGYEVVAAQNGVEALQLFRDDPHRFNLVITDQIMPDVTGITLANRMLEIRGDLPIILFTGYSEVTPAEKTKAAGIREFVMKPLLKREMAETIRRVLDAERGPARI
jgi:CheY-like chemotaxis protein